MFKFPLQALLQHRIFIEERLQRELADCERIHLAAQHQLDHWRREQITQIEHHNNKTIGGIRPSDAIAHHRFMSRLAALEQDQVQVVADTQRKLAVKRGDLLEAVKQRKTLERLKAKQERAHRNAVRKKEKAFLNEIAISRFNRQAE